MKLRGRDTEHGPSDTCFPAPLKVFGAGVLGFRVSGLGFRVFGFRVSGLGFRVLGFRV